MTSVIKDLVALRNQVSEPSSPPGPPSINMAA